MQPETRFKTKVVALLKQVDTLWLVKVQQVTIRGTPDILMCVRGKFVAWELKVGSNKASDLQQYTLDAITKAGGIARVVTPENLKESLEEISCL